MLKPYSTAGPARTDPAAHDTRASAAQPRRGLGWLPPPHRRLTVGSRTSARETGDEELTAAQLVDGDSSGESSGAMAFTSPVRI